MSSLTNPPAKIALSSATKISLNDRFTTFAKTSKQIEKTKPQGAGGNNSANSAIGLASARNRKLALQMASRPNVQAALKIKKKSIQQRLGVRANPRINQAARVPGQAARQGGIDPSRLSGGGAGGKLFNRSKKFNLSQRLNRSDMVLKRVNKNNNSLNTSKGSVKGVKRVGGGASNIRNRLRMGNNKKLQNLKGRRRGGGVGGGNAATTVGGGQRIKNLNPAQLPKIKNKLDKDLDQYMSKSKSHLDMDLDQYMAKSKSHLDADLDTYMAQASGSS